MCSGQPLETGAASGSSIRYSRSRCNPSEILVFPYLPQILALTFIGDGTVGMSFAQKVEALRSLMGVPSDAPLPAAVEMMNIAMGIVGEGALPKQVDSLVCATGVSLAGDPRLVPQATVVTHVAVDARRPQMDNLDSQCQPEYLMSEECQTDDHKVHALPSLAVNHRAALRTSRHATRQPSHLPLRCYSRRRTACESRLLAHPGASRQDRPDAASGRRAQAADQNLHGQGGRRVAGGRHQLAEVGEQRADGERPADPPRAVALQSDECRICGVVGYPRISHHFGYPGISWDIVVSCCCFLFGVGPSLGMSDECLSRA